MTEPIARDPTYRRRRFEAEIIELFVRWYITYRLNYRDLVAMMAERGLPMSHTRRAVENQGKTVDILLRPDRGIAATQAFFIYPLVG